ncbi:hypothetical protein Gohar_028315 [Gossypium harknessii]|uniref:Uncharacterized protein n=1 Tax=Gossypium harknessii TaxID=34285 RepID=A0A7J9ID51_9ROSI|nr:hypothetical protein [Gossypium harknessii]
MSALLARVSLGIFPHIALHNRSILPFLNGNEKLFFREVDLVPTVEEYTTLLCCPRIQADFLKKANEHNQDERAMDTKKRVDVFALCIYRLVILPKVLGHIDDAVLELFDRFDKRVTPVLTFLVETFRSLSAYRRAVPLLGIWGAIGYVLLLVLRQYRSRNFIPATPRLAQFEFAYKDTQVREDALERDLLENQNENFGLRAWVAELERSLHQYLELLETNNEHWKEQFQRSQGQIRDRDHIMGEAVTQGRELARLLKKVKALSIRARPPYIPLGFIPENVQAQLDTYPRGVPVIIRLQQYQVGTSAPVNYPTGSGFNPENNSTNPVIPDLVSFLCH